MSKCYATVWPASWPPSASLVLEFEAEDVIQGVAQARAFASAALAFANETLLIKSVEMKRPRGREVFQPCGDRFARELLQQAIATKGQSK